MLKSLTFNSIIGLFAAAIVFAVGSSKAHAHTHHSANICSATAPEICAHVGYDTINTSNAASLMLHFMPKSVDPALVTNVKVSLWMPNMGHGTKPVRINRLDSAHIEVTDAYFIMTGNWDIRVDFDYAQGTHQIVIPIEVK